ncbi:Heat shock protein [Musa troglodytarum]|uniref:Heat shock protein n=1 Tax=Musa troglodytarum TaxID=320322 RepID=A0A9E7HL52_9LILI|nr:Heat shock protein [Musa troglodytarum]
MRVRCEAAVAEKESEEASGEKFEYQAKVSRLLDLIVHSLYSHKEVFLRELVSNASDALDKLRFLSVTDPSLLGDAGDLEIRVKPDPDNGTIMITDTGLGMTKEELIDCLGTIAQSGTSRFLNALKENKDVGTDNGLIGQFGVGFYSAFLVAEREDENFEFADPTRVQALIKNYSQFVSFPIYTWQEKSRTVEVEEEEDPKEEEEAKTKDEKKKKKKTVTEKYWDWELANETKPIWMRNPKEVEKYEYNEFYKKTFNEFRDPLAYTHFTTEGEVEFRSVLYIPGMAPLNNEDLINPKTKNIRLYVKRVFISDDFDGELDYKKFWENFGKLLKLGCIEDSGNHKRLAPLLRFYSSKSEEELISLDQYVENMGENQKAIYYLATDSLKSAKTAPFLEKLVLYLVEPIDEVAIQNLQSYKEKKFADISKEDLELGDEDEVTEREDKQEYNLLCDWMKQQLGDKAACKNDPSSTEAKRAVDLLYDTALISSGYIPDSPAELGNKIYEMMGIALGGRWGRSESEEAAEGAEATSAQAGSSDATEAEVVEPSEVEGGERVEDIKSCQQVEFNRLTAAADIINNKSTNLKRCGECMHPESDTVIACLSSSASLHHVVEFHISHGLGLRSMNQNDGTTPKLESAKTAAESI